MNAVTIFAIAVVFGAYQSMLKNNINFGLSLSTKYGVGARMESLGNYLHLINLMT